jgi:hypothetical protein
MRENRNAYSVSVGRPEGKTDGIILLKWIYKKWDNRGWSEFM